MNGSLPDSPFVSIIVPVFNQWNLVPMLLQALEAQAPRDFDFEVLLVDNGSEIVLEATGDPSFVRRLVCTTPGSYAARNYGAFHAKGDVFAFTDADCRPCGRWLAEAVRCFDNSQAHVLIAGGISIFPSVPSHPNRYELYDMILGMPQSRYVSRGYAITANLFVPREIFHALGGFDERRFSGGDADFCRRATRQGVALRYCSGALVEHPARDNLNALITKVRRVKGGQLPAGSLFRRVTWLVRAFLPPLRAWARTACAREFSVYQRATVCMVQTRLWIAEIAEVFRLLVGKRAERR